MRVFCPASVGLRTKRPKSLWSNYPLCSFYAHCTPHFRKKTPKMTESTDFDMDSQFSWQNKCQLKGKPNTRQSDLPKYFFQKWVLVTPFSQNLICYRIAIFLLLSHTPQGTSSNNSKLQCIIDIEQWTYFHTICSVTIMINIAIAVVQIRQLIYRL